MNRTLWHHINSYDADDFNNEVEFYRITNANMSRVCKQSTLKKSMNDTTTVMVVPASDWEGSFYLSTKDCYMIGTNLRTEIRQSLDRNMNKLYRDFPKPWNIPGC